MTEGFLNLVNESKFRDIFTDFRLNALEDSSLYYSAIDIANHHIDSMLDVLRRQRAVNCRMRNSARPISRLPTEILSDIFVATVANEITRKPFSTTSTMVPLHLSHVCHTWRSVAFDLSEIWATVHCRVVKGKATVQAKHLDDWLSRSKERLLSIRISFENELSWIDIPAKAIIITLIPYCHRWKNLDFVVLKAWFPILELVQGKMENLQSLSVRTPGLNPNSNSALLAFFAEAPRLRKVVLQCANYALPWTQLTSITLLQPSIAQVLAILQHCPLLITGKFLQLKDDHVWQFTPSAPHSALERLSISLKDQMPIPIDEMLDHLILPKLCHLTLILPKWDWSPLDQIEALVNRSGCPLMSLEIGGPTLSDDQILDFLQLSKHLVHFNNHVHPFIMSNDENDN